MHLFVTTFDLGTQTTDSTARTNYNEDRTQQPPLLTLRIFAGFYRQLFHLWRLHEVAYMTLCRAIVQPLQTLAYSLFVRTLFTATVGMKVRRRCSSRCANHSEKTTLAKDSLYTCFIHRNAVTAHETRENTPLLPPANRATRERCHRNPCIGPQRPLPQPEYTTSQPSFLTRRSLWPEAKSIWLELLCSSPDTGIFIECK